MSIISDLVDNKIRVEEAASKAIKDGEMLSQLLERIFSKQDKIRFNSYQVLLNIYEHNPEILYPQWDYLADLLNATTNIVAI